MKIILDMKTRINEDKLFRELLHRGLTLNEGEVLDDNTAREIAQYCREHIESFDAKWDISTDYEHIGGRGNADSDFQSEMQGYIDEYLREHEELGFNPDDPEWDGSDLFNDVFWAAGDLINDDEEKRKRGWLSM